MFDTNLLVTNMFVMLMHGTTNRGRPPFLA